MSKAREPRERDTRARILSCAARMFRRQGYAAVTLRNVAKGVGMTTGSVYYHFTSKEEIVREILEEGHRRILEEVQAAIAALGPEPDCPAVLRAAIVTHIGCLLGEDSFPSANIRIFSHVPAEVRRSTLAGRHRYESYWADLLGRCQELGTIRSGIDPTILAYLLFGAMNWTIEWYDPKRHDIETVADDLASLIVSEGPDQAAALRPQSA